jgi:hypothetical protein
LRGARDSLASPTHDSSNRHHHFNKSSKSGFQNLTLLPLIELAILDVTLFIDGSGAGMVKLSDQITTALKAAESGMYCWLITSNMVFADARIASLFQLPPDVAERGLPLERYLERLHPDDRQETEQAINHAVVTGEPYRQHYRVVHDDQSILHLLGVGQCFRDGNGVPYEYAGMIYDTTAGDPACSIRAIADLCLAAYGIAEQEGEAEIQALLASLLTQIDHPDFLAETASALRH